MPLKDAEERRASGRVRSQRYRASHRSPLVTPGRKVQLPAVTLRSHGEILGALELAVTLAAEAPYVAQIVISAARAAGTVLQAYQVEGRLSALEALFAIRGRST